jgi:hypothetical protein
MSSSFSLSSFQKFYYLLEGGITQGLCQSAGETRNKENIFELNPERVRQAYLEYPMLLGG